MNTYKYMKQHMIPEKTEEIKMDYELSFDQMEQIAGGTARKINTGTSDKAAIRSDPWIAKRNQIDALINGTIVKTINDELIFDPGSRRNFVKIRFINKYGDEAGGYVAASIVGLPR